MLNGNWICRRVVASLLIAVAAVGGCAGGKGDVSGQVLFKNEPIPSGRVNLVCQTGSKEVFSAEIVKGKYTILGVPVGPVKITVETFPPPSVALSPPVKIPGGIPPDIKGMPEPGARPPAPDKFVAIPPRYGNLHESGLTYTVTPGEQNHDITLQP
jgi:hypothetical protein